MQTKENNGNFCGFNCLEEKWRRGVAVITTAQLHSTKLELWFCAGLKPARRVSEIRDGEDLC